MSIQPNFPTPGRRRKFLGLPQPTKPLHSNLPFPAPKKPLQVWMGSKNSTLNNLIEFNDTVGDNFIPLTGSDRASLRTEKEAQALLAAGARFFVMTIHLHDGQEDGETGGAVDWGIRVFTLRLNGEDTSISITTEGKQATYLVSGRVTANKGDLISVRHQVVQDPSELGEFGELAPQLYANVALLFEVDAFEDHFIYSGTGHVQDIGSPSGGALWYSHRPLFAARQLSSVMPVLNPFVTTGPEQVYPRSLVSVPGGIRRVILSPDRINERGADFIVALIKGHPGLGTTEVAEVLTTYRVGEGDVREFSTNHRIRVGELWALGTAFLTTPTGSGSDNPRVSYGVLVRSSEPDRFMLGNGNDSGLATTDIETEEPIPVYRPWSWGEDMEDIEKRYRHVSPARMELKGFYLDSNRQPSSGGTLPSSYRITSRINEEDGNVSALLSRASRTTEDENNKDFVSEGDLINWKSEVVEGLPGNFSFNSDGFSYAIGARVL